jgi:hypothetical protein
VFFNREWSRVKGDAKKRKIRDIARPCFANEESKNEWDDLFEGPELARGDTFQQPLKTSLGNRSGRVSEGEELIETGDEDGENETEEPSTKGG